MLWCGLLQSLSFCISALSAYSRPGAECRPEDRFIHTALPPCSSLAGRRSVRAGCWLTFHLSPGLFLQNFSPASQPQHIPVHGIISLQVHNFYFHLLNFRRFLLTWRSCWGLAGRQRTHLVYQPPFPVLYPLKTCWGMLYPIIQVISEDGEQYWAVLTPGLFLEWLWSTSCHWSHHLEPSRLGSFQCTSSLTTYLAPTWSVCLWYCYRRQCLKPC